jgi:hypothetical protein
MNQPKMTDWRAMLFATRDSGWSILIRLLVGLVVFFPEGIQKLLFPDILGAGRFLRIDDLVFSMLRNAFSPKVSEARWAALGPLLL